MIADPERFLTCLRRLEERVHARGWDRPATVAFIYGARDGAVTHGPAVRLPSPPGGNPIGVLIGTALATATDPVPFPRMSDDQATRQTGESRRWRVRTAQTQRLRDQRPRLHLEHPGQGVQLVHRHHLTPVVLQIRQRRPAHRMQPVHPVRQLLHRPAPRQPQRPHVGDDRPRHRPRLSDPARHPVHLRAAAPGRSAGRGNGHPDASRSTG